MSSIETVWEYREEVLYPSLFGKSTAGICVLDGPIFTDVFGQETYDPRWLFLGVCEFKPTPTRNSWLYVTSGASTPWNCKPHEYDPEDYSWLGVEFVMEVPEQAEWPVVVLQRLLAYQVLLCHDRYPGFDPLDYGHRVPIGGPITEGSDLEIVLLAEPTHYPSTAQLDSGKFDFIHVVGITKDEREHAKNSSSEELLKALNQHGAFPVTDPKRKSIIEK